MIDPLTLRFARRKVLCLTCSCWGHILLIDGTDGRTHCTKRDKGIDTLFLTVDERFACPNAEQSAVIQAVQLAGVTRRVNAASAFSSLIIRYLTIGQSFSKSVKKCSRLVHKVLPTIERQKIENFDHSLWCLLVVNLYYFLSAVSFAS